MDIFCWKPYEQGAEQWLASIPAVDVLRQVWLQQFGIENGKIFWRSRQQEGIPPAARLINSPYDLQAHYVRKITTCWIGYKVHLTETCEQDLPHLITNVATTAGPIPDLEMTASITKVKGALTCNSCGGYRLFRYGITCH